MKLIRRRWEEGNVVTSGFFFRLKVVERREGEEDEVVEDVRVVRILPGLDPGGQ